MPQYKFVSAKQVLARVIRGLGYKLPSTYMDDILEWIPEGLNQMQVTNSLVVQTTGDKDCVDQIVVSNYCAKLPCGFISILGVYDEDNNKLSSGNDVTSINQNFGSSSDARISVFNTSPYTYQTNDGLPVNQPGVNIPLYGEDLIQKKEGMAFNQRFYNISGNYIQTGFCEGYIKMRYLALPVCKDGYPLIPDNDNFKNALEWYIIKRLIGSGYEHKVFKYDYAEQMFEKYAARGMGEVSFYSPDEAAKVNRSLVRLIPPTRMEEDFFINA